MAYSYQALGLVRLVVRRIREDERDLLAGWEHEPLFLRDLAGHSTLRIDPEPMWSHDSLEAAISRADVQQFVKVNFGADAFLGGRWIGSSEV
ncbi:hypothetical protein [Paraburkholderia megapolitana]|uniref:hypothetical protein n=1 Tax=Paraburkholderia megapolitana TaxID=420953 RepID=UPI0038B9CCE0